MAQAKMVFVSGTKVISLGDNLINGNIAGGTTTLDNSTNLCPYATATLDTPAAFGSAPTSLSTVDLYIVRQYAYDGGIYVDTAAPSSTNTRGAELVGSFVMYALNERQIKTITISLNGIRKAKFFIMNNTGQTMLAQGSPGGNIDVLIAPFSYQDA